MHLVGHALSRAGDALRCIGAARDDHGAGYARSIIRFAELYGRRLYSIAEIEMQGLLNPAIAREQLDLRQSKEAQLQMQRRHNPRAYWSRTEDKGEFEQFCRNAGLPVPCNFGSFDVAGSDVVERAGHRAVARAVLASATAPHLIVKPIDGVYGLGVARLAVEDGTFLCHGAVGSDILRAIRADRLMQGAGSLPQPVAAR